MGMSIACNITSVMGHAVINKKKKKNKAVADIHVVKDERVVRES
jgi:hypothetical protein